MVGHANTTECLENDLESPQLEKISTWQTYEESKLPNGGYGWVVVASIFLINAHLWGMTSVSPTFYHNRVMSLT
jgi:hypothetical protein